MEGAIRRHAAYQAVDAYSEQHEESWHDLDGAPGFVDIWSGILDRKICPVCWDLDGTIVRHGMPFPGDAKPPVHGHCRCIVVTSFIPPNAWRKLPGAELDYGALKDDIKEYLGKSRLQVRGQRHAADFVREAIATTSPEALTRRLRERRYTSSPARAPRLPRTRDLPPSR